MIYIDSTTGIILLIFVTVCLSCDKQYFNPVPNRYWKTGEVLQYDIKGALEDCTRACRMTSQCYSYNWRPITQGALIGSCDLLSSVTRILQYSFVGFVSYVCTYYTFHMSIHITGFICLYV